MFDNPQQDSGTSEEEIIYIEDYEEFTPVQMMKKQADKMMMPPPQDTTQWQATRSVYKHPQATRSVCKRPEVSTSDQECLQVTRSVYK